jgi:hypothetical protein
MIYTNLNIQLENLYSKDHIFFQKDIFKNYFYEKLFEIASYFRDF